MARRPKPRPVIEPPQEPVPQPGLIEPTPKPVDIAFYQHANGELLRKLQAVGASVDEPLTMLLIRRATAAVEARAEAAEQATQALHGELEAARQSLAAVTANRDELAARLAESQAERSRAMSQILQLISTMIKEATPLMGKKPDRIEGWLNRSELLDIEYYLANNVDVAAGQLDPLYHYLQYGMDEGRPPQAVFAGSRTP